MGDAGGGLSLQHTQCVCLQAHLTLRKEGGTSKMGYSDEGEENRNGEMMLILMVMILMMMIKMKKLVLTKTTVIDEL